MDTSRVRVLLVDDSEEEFALTRDLLSSVPGVAYDLEWESQYDAALALACSNRYDVCLIDHRLGEHDGLELLRSAIARGCRAPMVLLTGRGDDSVDDAAMNAGAADYLVKGRIDASMLNRSIRYCLARKHAEAERFALEHQLRQAQKMALVGQLAGGIAHDFNNLLTAILGYAALGQNDTALQDGPRASFQEIQRAAQRAADLTQKLLAFSRRQVLEVQLLSLNDVVVNTRSMLRRLIGENIRQEMLTAPDLGLVRADQGQLEQVLINMAINARDAMPAGGKLTVETANVTPGQDHAALSIEPKAERYVMLSISDTGTGIPADVLPHIFEPFFTTKDDGKGTGLGLSTCQGIIEQASGHITADSDPQTGTTFKIYLPRVDGSVPDPGIGNERQVSRESERVGATQPPT